MSDVLFRDRKLRKVKKESVEVQRVSLKNKGRPEKKRGEENGKK